MLDKVLARGWVPDPLIRFGIRRLLAERLRDEGRFDAGRRQARQASLVESLHSGPIAVGTDAANEQHYEVPPAFFELVLGPRLKYSSALWPAGTEDLAAAEKAMIQCYIERGELADGQRILELGCGWGSLCLELAARFPASEVVTLSNSAPQRQFIEGQAAARGFSNLRVVTADINHFSPAKALNGNGRGAVGFDRIVSIEMLEHVRNHRALFARMADWLVAGGKAFIHIFCHRELVYPFEARDEGDWMARYFFTGGLMPSFDLLPASSGRLGLEASWKVGGEHYARTARAWRENMEAKREAIEPILAEAYGAGDMRRWWAYWRIFFLSCEELFAYGDGKEWIVGHYRFVKP